jgi:alanine racemase
VNRGPIAEINLAALQHNLDIISRIVENRHIIAVVKADAYGHGSVEISKKLIDGGISFLAVAFSGEARVLRDSGIDARIIVLFDNEGLEDYFEYDLIPVIHEKNTAREFSREAVKRGRKAPVHVKIDTGMGRVGLSREKALNDAVEISKMEGIALEGLLSHFSEADLSDRSYAEHQLSEFNKIRSAISEGIQCSVISHIANSAAVLSLGDSLLDAVRPGIMLYGCSPFSKEDYGLMPLMTLKSKILVIRNLPSGFPVSYGRTFVTERKSRIAVIPVGYADGYNRLFSNNAEVLVKGKKAPVVGRVCMDLTMIDITDIEGVSEDDEVVLLGQQGDLTITAQELAERINTIPYEILTSLGRSARRVYIH